MTSAHFMLLICRLRSGAFFLALVLLAGCAPKQPLQDQLTLVSPFEGTQLWAVAPFANEAGVSIVKPDRIADLFVEQAEQVRGIDTVPVNRVLVAMQRLGMRSISTPADAFSLMNALKVDGLIVGTVTAYDPYPPPKIGAAIQLYLADESMGMTQIDPISLTRAITEEPIAAGALSNRQPVAQASGLFDSKSHDMLAFLERFAAGRTEPDSAHGSRIYLVNMELYTQFVAFELLRDLLDTEPAATQEATQSAQR